MDKFIQFMVESFDKPMPLVKDETTTNLIRYMVPHIDNINVFSASVGDQDVKIVKLKHEGVNEVHFTNFTGGLPRAGKPEPGDHSRKATPFFGAMYQLMKPELDAGEPIRIQSMDQEMHDKHMRLIERLGRRVYGDDGIDIEHQGHQESHSAPGRFPTSIVRRA